MYTEFNGSSPRMHVTCNPQLEVQGKIWHDIPSQHPTMQSGHFRGQQRESEELHCDGKGWMQHNSDLEFKGRDEHRMYLSSLA